MKLESVSGALAARSDGRTLRFLGIPFAAPPIGPLRFRRAAPVVPWRGTLDATKAAPAPLQPAVTGLGMRGAVHTSEDCLYLNVFTPACDASRRPVLVWIFGGGYLNGDGADPLFDGSNLAAGEDLVVVTCNYRLGALGFAAIESANQGLDDQIAVMRWVRVNIERFGGDPARVTIVGESAGAMSVCNLLASPRAAGLFSRAIAQSGAADNVASLAQSLESTDALRTLLVPTPLEASAEVVMSAQAAVITALRPVQRAMPFRPCLDRDVLPELPLAVAADSPIPLIMGINRDEQRLYMRATARIDDETLARQLTHRLRTLAEPAVAVAAVLDHYRNERPRSPINANAAILADVDTELNFRRPMLRYAEQRRAPTWLYRFDWPSPALRGWLGACHALEIPFVFGNFDLPGTAKFAGAGPEADRLSRSIMGLWGHFARHGEPPASWPRFDRADARQLHLDRHIAPRRLSEDLTIRFWNGLLRNDAGAAVISSSESNPATP